jgi:hypothetical protein
MVLDGSEDPSVRGVDGRGRGLRNETEEEEPRETDEREQQEETREEEREEVRDGPKRRFLLAFSSSLATSDSTQKQSEWLRQRTRWQKGQVATPLA